MIDITNEELNYRLNFFDSEEPFNRFEIPITYKKSLEIIGVISRMQPDNKGVLKLGSNKIWITANLPDKAYKDLIKK